MFGTEIVLRDPDELDDDFWILRERQIQLQITDHLTARVLGICDLSIDDSEVTFSYMDKAYHVFLASDYPHGASTIICSDSGACDVDFATECAGTVADLLLATAERVRKSSKLSHVHAALRLQCLFRCFLARRHLRQAQRRKQENDAAVRLQCMIRCFLARQKADSLRCVNTSYAWQQEAYVCLYCQERFDGKWAKYYHDEHTRACYHNAWWRKRKLIWTLPVAAVSPAHARLSQLLVRAVGGDLADVAAVLNCTHSRIYSLAQSNYGMRGGKKYYKPRGWLRFAVGRATAERKHKMRNWCVAYHGTDLKAAMKILVEGLRKPGEGVQMKHGSAFSKTKQSLYFSPALGYASFPCYAELAETVKGCWVQCVLQVRVRPGSFEEHPVSLRGKSYWPSDLRFDEHFDRYDSHEWLLEDRADHEVVGLLVRELGEGADPNLYGAFAPLVMGAWSPTKDKRTNRYNWGPEYHLTQLLASEFRENGWLASTSRRWTWT